MEHLTPSAIARQLVPDVVSTARLLLPAQLYLPHPCGRVPVAVLPPPSLESYHLPPCRRPDVAPGLHSRLDSTGYFL
ncbi:MAG TPA: hypothetical protein VI451_08320 [Anaerolineales bacterium]|nr:hypothetical protein [Anaerolineales bacterium]